MGGVGTVLGRVFTFLTQPGRTLLSRDAGVVNQVRERLDDLEKRLDGRLESVVGAPAE